jgi:agmatine deiminase
MPGAPLLPDWEADTVLLIAPAGHMGVYDSHLPELLSFYADFAATVAASDRAVCVRSGEPEQRASPSPEIPARLHWCEGRIGDIWVRDFAPLQTISGAVAFIYDPEYAPRRHSRSVQQSLLGLLRTDPAFAGIGPVVQVDLRLEGGNITHDGAGTAIVTDKILSRNRSRGRREIEKIMRDALALDRLVIVPSEPGDRFGHVDGMMRWVNERQILLNDYSGSDAADRAFAGQLLRLLDRELGRVERCTIPYPASRDVYRRWPDAAGNYVNFLRTRNRIYVPLYGLPQEDLVRKIFERLFADRVSYVYPGALTRYGGVLNCITWAWRTGTGRSAARSGSRARGAPIATSGSQTR